MSLGEKYIL